MRQSFLLPASLRQPGGRGLFAVRECLNHHDDAVVNLGRKTGEVFLCTAFKQDAIHGHLRLRSAR